MGLLGGTIGWLVTEPPRAVLEGRVVLGAILGVATGIAAAGPPGALLVMGALAIGGFLGAVVGGLLYANEGESILAAQPIGGVIGLIIGLVIGLAVAARRN
jgi:hypothetical protein